MLNIVPHVKLLQTRSTPLKFQSVTYRGFRSENGPLTELEFGPSTECSGGSLFSLSGFPNMLCPGLYLLTYCFSPLPGV